MPAWTIETLSLLFLVLLLAGATRFFLIKLRKSPSKSNWKQGFGLAALVPIQALLWVLVATFGAELALRIFSFPGWIPAISSFRKIAIILCIAWACFRWKSQVLLPSDQKFFLKPQMSELASKILTLAILFIAGLSILQVFGLDIMPLLTIGSIGAAALGFAAKDAIANFYGGLVLHLSHPFSLHDQIELPQAHIQGHVEKIGWYFTTVRTLQKQPLYLPNSLFATEYLINLSRMTHRRIEEKLSLRFEDADKIPQIIEQIRTYLKAHPQIDSNLPIQVYLLGFKESSIDIECKAYTTITQYDPYMELRQAALLQIYQLIRQAKAAMPFPITEVYLRQT